MKTYAVGDTLKFSIPIKDVTEEVGSRDSPLLTTLQMIFSQMQTARTQLGVSDWGVANASLEEVFISIAVPKTQKAAPVHEVGRAVVA